MSEIKVIDLPGNVLEVILKQKQISIRDVVNFGATCKGLHKIEFTEDFWKTKFLQRFVFLSFFNNYFSSYWLFVESNFFLFHRWSNVLKETYVGNATIQNDFSWFEETKLSVKHDFEFRGKLEEIAKRHANKDRFTCDDDIFRLNLSRESPISPRFPVVLDLFMKFLNNEK